MSRHVLQLVLTVLLAQPAIAEQDSRVSPRTLPQRVEAAARPQMPVQLTLARPNVSTNKPISISQKTEETGLNPAQTAADQSVRPLRSSLRTPERESTAARERSSDATLITVGSSLAIVLGVFFLVAWITRRTAPRGMAPLPGEVLQSLGRAPLVGRQQAQLLRVGKKLVLVSITPGGVEPITEITDPAEVDRLSSLCQQTQPGSITDSFRNILSQYANEPAPRGFIGDPVRR